MSVVPSTELMDGVVGPFAVSVCDKRHRSTRRASLAITARWRDSRLVLVGCRAKPEESEVRRFVLQSRGISSPRD